MKPTEPPAGAHHHDPDTMHNVGVAHEHSDINVRAIITFLVVLALVCAVVAALMYGLFRVLEGRAAAADPVLSPVAPPPTQMPATTMESPAFGAGPEPHLLTNEPAALRQFRAHEDQRLGTYGWVDEKAGTARMPLAEAKKLIVERGLPARAEEADPLLGTRMPAYGEASSGRIITGPPRGAGFPGLGPAAATPQQEGPGAAPKKDGGL